MGNESEAAVLTIAKREIVIKTKSYYIKNGGELPEKLELAVDEIKLSHEDQWAEGGEPKAVLEGTTLEEIDTKVGKDYVITVSAAVEDSRKDNYNIIPENGQLCIAELTDNGKSRDVLKLAEDAVTSKFMMASHLKILLLPVNLAMIPANWSTSGLHLMEKHPRMREAIK